MAERRRTALRLLRLLREQVGRYRAELRRVSRESDRLAEIEAGRPLTTAEAKRAHHLREEAERLRLEFQRLRLEFVQLQVDRRRPGSS